MKSIMSPWQRSVDNFSFAIQKKERTEKNGSISNISERIARIFLSAMEFFLFGLNYFISAFEQKYIFYNDHNTVPSTKSVLQDIRPVKTATIPLELIPKKADSKPTEIVEVILEEPIVEPIAPKLVIPQAVPQTPQSNFYYRLKTIGILSVVALTALGIWYASSNSEPTSHKLPEEVINSKIVSETVLKTAAIFVTNPVAAPIFTPVKEHSIKLVGSNNTLLNNPELITKNVFSPMTKFFAGIGGISAISLMVFFSRKSSSLPQPVNLIDVPIHVATDITEIFSRLGLDDEEEIRRTDISDGTIQELKTSSSRGNIGASFEVAKILLIKAKTLLLPTIFKDFPQQQLAQPADIFAVVCVRDSLTHIDKACRTIFFSDDGLSPRDKDLLKLKNGILDLLYVLEPKNLEASRRVEMLDVEGLLPSYFQWKKDLAKRSKQLGNTL